LEASPRVVCPCCRHRTLRERGAFEICPVCSWEDDGQDESDAGVVRGGPNGGLSLTQAQANFRTFGASDHARAQRLERWRDTWRELGARRADDALFHRLLACYDERHRHYHTLQHLTECLGQLDDLRACAERPAEVEVALWFHDAIYAPRKHDNEQRSAERARDSVLAAGADTTVAARIHELVLATRHRAVPARRDAEVLVDVDLAILGAEPARFDEYEEQVRREYTWVPEILYRRERRKVLLEFAQRAAIYSTAPARAARETQARSNLARSLARL